MPTRGRRELAARALADFEAQTWPVRELVILDDADDCSFLSPPTGRDIRYHVLAQRFPIGAKRNVAVSRARGEIICHWDSDDRYALGRIEDQVRRLLATGADVTGYHSMLFEDLVSGQRWRYEHPPGYAPGVSLCYRRDFWRRRPFPDLRIGEDKAFEHGADVLTVDGGGMIVASIWPGNTSPRDLSTPQWRKLACA